MPDKVVVLTWDAAPDGSGAGVGNAAALKAAVATSAAQYATTLAVSAAQPAAQAQAPGPVAGGPVRVRVEGSAPHWQCRLTLWDAGGGNPEECDPQQGSGAAVRINSDVFNWDSPYSAKDLDGRTLTWFARFFGESAQSYRLSLVVLQGANELAESQFLYEGFFSSSDGEECSGRFHFSGKPQPASAAPAASPAPSASG